MKCRLVRKMQDWIPGSISSRVMQSPIPAFPTGGYKTPRAIAKSPPLDQDAIWHIRRNSRQIQQASKVRANRRVADNVDDSRFRCVTNHLRNDEPARSHPTDRRATLGEASFTAGKPSRNLSMDIKKIKPG